MNLFFRLSRLFLALLIPSLIILSSCSTTNDVASDGLIQKRKYRRGFHLNLGNHTRKSEAVARNHDDWKTSVNSSAEASIKPIPQLDIDQSQLERFSKKNEPKLDLRAVKSIRKSLKRADRDKTRETPVIISVFKNKTPTKTEDVDEEDEEYSDDIDPLSLISLGLGVGSLVFVVGGFLIFFPIAMLGLGMAVAAIVTGVIAKGIYSTLGIIAGILAILAWLAVIVILILFLAVFLF